MIPKKNKALAKKVKALNFGYEKAIEEFGVHSATAKIARLRAQEKVLSLGKKHLMGLIKEKGILCRKLQTLKGNELKKAKLRFKEVESELLIINSLSRNVELAIQVQKEEVAKSLQ